MKRHALVFSGIADFIVTGTSDLSRNLQFGLLLGERLLAADAKKKIGTVVEGECTVKSARDLGVKLGLNLPITYAMYEILYEGKAPIKNSS